MIFALVQAARAPAGARSASSTTSIAIDSDVVDDVIEKQPSQARFLAGMVVWRPGELNDEITAAPWYVLAPTGRSSCASRPRLWEELVGRSERKANAF